VDSAAECPLRRGFRGGSSSPAADSTVKRRFDRGFRGEILGMFSLGEATLADEPLDEGVGGDGLVERAVGRAEEGAVRTTGLDDDGRDSRLGAEVHREVSVVFHTPMVHPTRRSVNPPPADVGNLTP
jgi:hypothetical protein